jgi:hypothetical protein
VTRELALAIYTRRLLDLDKDKTMFWREKDRALSEEELRYAQRASDERARESAGMDQVRRDLGIWAARNADGGTERRGEGFRAGAEAVGNKDPKGLDGVGVERREGEHSLDAKVAV